MGIRRSPDEHKGLLASLDASRSMALKDYQTPLYTIEHSSYMDGSRHKNPTRNIELPEHPTQNLNRPRTDHAYLRAGLPL